MTTGYGGGLRRVAWVALVVGAAWALVHGMLQTTYFEPTGEALAVARVGQRWLWAGSLALAGACWVAVQWWRPGVWSLACLVAVGPVALLVESWGWIPLVAVLPGLPLLLIGVTGVLLSPPRPATA